MKTVFMGTPDFSVPTLEALDKISTIQAVVTKPDVRKNRGKKLLPSPVKEKAAEMGIPVLEPEKLRDNDELLKQLKEAEPDFIVVTAYGKILPKEMLELPRFGCINVHASLLPKFRGAAPVQRAILEGEQETGVTIMRMAEGMDTGDMYCKGVTEIGDKSCSVLWQELAQMGGKLIEETLPEIERGRLKAEKQDDSQATYAPYITKEEGHIDYSKTPAEIIRKIRALDMWPGAFSMYKGEPLKIWDAAVTDGETEEAPGTVLDVSDKGIDVAASKGIIRLTEIQTPGKKRMAVEQYLRGNSVDKQEILR